MSNSTHKVEVVPVVLEKHPNADLLSVVKVFGYTVVVKTEDWLDKNKGAYIPPDSIVPDKPEFAFLNGHFRIKTHKFRGIMSQGLLWPIEDFEIGENVAQHLGIEHYELPETELSTYGDIEQGPYDGIVNMVYDIETWYRYQNVFEEGEQIIITEKLHGCNWRGIYWNGRMWCGSRRQWKKENKDTVWWKVLEQNPWIEEFCREHEGQFLYGEVYGWIQNLRYGHKKNEFSFRAFDVLDPKECKWMNAEDFYHTSWYKLNYSDGSNHEIQINRVPVIYEGPYSEEKIRELISGKSLIADNMREGIVIRPISERWNKEIGRVHLKAVSAEYLAKEK